MARSSDSEKVLAWQERLARFPTAGLSVIRFCQQEGVSIATFYRWRNKLAQRKHAPAAPDPPAFANVTLVAEDPFVQRQIVMDTPAGRLRTVAIDDGISPEPIENHGVVFPCTERRRMEVMGGRDLVVEADTAIVITFRPFRSSSKSVSCNPMVPR